MPKYRRIADEHLEPPPDEPEIDEDEADFYAEQEISERQLNRQEK